MNNTVYNKITVSLPDNISLIIGQVIPLELSYINPDALLTAPNITFSGLTNITISTTHGDPITTPVPMTKSLSGNDHIYTLCVYLIVQNKDNNPKIKDKDTITYTITSDQNSDILTRQATARTIHNQSLLLTIDTPFLESPSSPNLPPNGTLSTSVTTTLQGDSGPIKSGYIFIVDKFLQKKLQAINIYDDKNPITQLPLQSIGENQGILLSSDDKGKVSFKIYPQKTVSTVLDLSSMISGVTDPIIADTPIFIINLEPVPYLKTIPRPNIGGYSIPLTSDGLNNFRVAIDHYENADSGDYILFFTQTTKNNKKVYSEHFFRVKDAKIDLGLGNFHYVLPYGMFEVGVPTKFSYMAVYELGVGAKVSQPLEVTYEGTGTNEPSNRVKRNYDYCTVYTSTYLDPGDRHILGQGVPFGIEAIKLYQSNKNNHPNTGLFVVVPGSSTSKTQVPPGSQVTVTFYVESENKNFSKSLPTKTMPNTGSGPNNDPLLYFNIPYGDIVNVLPYIGEGGGPGTLSVDYSFIKDGNPQYGKVWYGYIDTRPE
ncbi:hypothetical protein FE394_16620 [Xenorhabdus sp. Reich]|uniref:Inverse autotransporter beta-barrel domain-containing protein n=1 Tax=Xenorhabdus littoralis TaxID=2582835 RepID=A0ABU4SQ38_9GAMM|nr:hypothetical protein [Xenorhabdus sp. Reich]MDX8000767.1 hypothetical protein [Xenorhabdus sp. Reich]